MTPMDNDAAIEQLRREHATTRKLAKTALAVAVVAAGAAARHRRLVHFGMLHLGVSQHGIDAMAGLPGSEQLRAIGDYVLSTVGEMFD